MRLTTRQMLIAKGLFGLYLAAWTFMLIVPNPVGVLKLLLLGKDIPESLGDLAGNRDKLIHGVGYFILVLLAWVSSHRLRAGCIQAWVVLFCFGAGHGALVEVIQQAGQSRQGDVIDWIADIVGLLAAMFVLWLFLPETRPSKPPTYAEEE